jgi:tetrahydromethanopterin S-methyltransferase subunit G
MRKAVIINKEARRGVFDNCEINGAVDNSGRDMKFINTSIGLKKIAGDHPILYAVVAGLVVNVVFSLVKYVYFLFA